MTFLFFGDNHRNVIIPKPNWRTYVFFRGVGLNHQPGSLSEYEFNPMATTVSWQAQLGSVRLHATVDGKSCPTLDSLDGWNPSIMLVGGLEHEFYDFPIIFGMSSFFRGVGWNHQPEWDVYHLWAVTSLTPFCAGPEWCRWHLYEQRGVLPAQVGILLGYWSEIGRILLEYNLGALY